MCNELERTQNAMSDVERGSDDREQRIDQQRLRGPLYAAAASAPWPRPPWKARRHTEVHSRRVDLRDVASSTSSRRECTLVESRTLQSANCGCRVGQSFPQERNTSGLTFPLERRTA